MLEPDSITCELRKNLEWLLNTRRTPLLIPNHFNELDQSILNYGISDFTRTNRTSSKLKKDFILEIERAIQRFEPRLKNVNVMILEEASDHTRLHFQIDGQLHTRKSMLHLTFETTLNPLSRLFKFK